MLSSINPFLVKFWKFLKNKNCEGLGLFSIIILKQMRWVVPKENICIKKNWSYQLHISLIWSKMSKSKFEIFSQPTFGHFLKLLTSKSEKIVLAEK